MTSVGPPQFDFDIQTGARPEPPAAPARNGLVVAVGVSIVVIIVGLVAVLWDPTPDRADSTTARANTQATDSSERRYDSNVAGIAVHAMVATDDGFMAYAAGPDPGTIARLTSRDGRRWDRLESDLFVDVAPGSNPVGVWPTTDGRFLGAFGAERGRNLTMSVSADGVSWTQLTTFRGDGLIRPDVVAVSSDSALVTVTETSGGPPRVVDQVVLDLSSGAVEPLALGIVTDDAWPFEVDDDGSVTRMVNPTESPVVVRSAVADPATGGFMVVTVSAEEFGPEGSLHQIRRILPDGRSVPFVGPHPWLVEELGVVDGDVVVFTDDLAYRIDSETSRWGSPRVFRFDSSHRYGGVITGAGGAAVLLTETDPDRDGSATVMVTSDAVQWTEVAIVEQIANPQLRALGSDQVVIEGFQIGVGTIRFAIPLDQ